VLFEKKKDIALIQGSRQVTEYLVEIEGWAMLTDFVAGMIFLLVFVFLIMALYAYALTTPSLTFDQNKLPLFVKSLAREAFLRGKTVMTPNDKGQIESYTGKKWQELDVLWINSLWVQEIERLKTRYSKWLV